ncbi:decaprenyl-phosphate phosphoribosyltransferase [Deltaproteobacteria bacterium IMCC39524]|nr:decaprenyl-phosphate phosphoribosyltransferase [Deltaproteobacteria bacterium IMCC39524]
MHPISMVKILRLHQWLKNLMLFFPPFLGGALMQPGMALRGIVPFLAFSLASSATYIFNDLRDQERDRQHPTKCRRPLASGALSKTQAVVLMVILLFGSGLLGSQISSRFLVYVGLYLFFSGFYSWTLKDWPIVDVFCVSLGFVLRLYAGGEAFGVYITDWLFLTVFLLSLFLSLGKRQSEKINLGEKAGHHRRTLEVYPDGFLENAMFLCGGSVIVTYSVYALSRPYMVYTVPLCMFGLLRYLFRVKSGKSGDPTNALLKDLPLLVVGFLWVVLVFWSIYQ